MHSRILHSRQTALLALGIAVLAVAGTASGVLSLVVPRSAAARPPYSFRLLAVDEANHPITGALFSAGGHRWRTDAAGEAEIAGAREVLAGSLSAPGYLPEPVVVGPENDGRVVRVRLWASDGGKRFSYHAAGDVMLGRRYLASRPGSREAPLDPDGLGRSARTIVAEVAPIFRPATFCTVNLETVVGSLAQSAAYPGKDIVLQTPGEALGALDELGVDAALGGNNHARDYRDVGIASTRSAVEERGMVYSGAGRNRTQAAVPARLGHGPAALVVFAFSGLSGEGVNDAYGVSSEAAAGTWIRQRSTWGYAERGRALVRRRSRTIAVAWRMFRALERRNPAAADRAWPALSAAYPQLQDWLARRGHGGANAWDPKRSTAAIRRAARGTAPVVVQLHGGIQYAPAPPARLIAIAHAAIDAGADIVIAHHPHVVQGFEWYRGKLMAFSLGNFVFDQDLLVSHPGGFLRTVWDGKRLLEARFVPTILENYRPLPVAGTTAATMLRRLAAISLLPARASRRGSGRTQLVPRELGPEPLVAHLERNTLRLGSGPPARVTEQRDLRAREVQPLSPDRLYYWGAGSAPPRVLAGRNLFPYGSFDDAAATSDGVLHWSFGNTTSRELDREDSYLVLRRSASSRRPALARPSSRIPIAEASFPSTARTFELRFRAHMAGQAQPSIRLDFYRLDAAGLSIETGSQAVGRQTVQLELPRDRRWHDVTVSVTPPHGRADYVLPYFVLEPTGSEAAFAIDDVALVEWRAAAGRVHPQALDYLENARPEPLHLRLAALSLNG